jgi:hypothetical protein
LDVCPGCGRPVGPGDDYVVAQEYRLEPGFVLHLNRDHLRDGVERRFHVGHFRRPHRGALLRANGSTRAASALAVALYCITQLRECFRILGDDVLAQALYVADPEPNRFRRVLSGEIVGEDVCELQAGPSIVVQRQPPLIDTPASNGLLEAKRLGVRQRELGRSDEQDDFQKRRRYTRRCAGVLACRPE